MGFAHQHRHGPQETTTRIKKKNYLDTIFKNWDDLQKSTYEFIAFIYKEYGDIYYMETKKNNVLMITPYDTEKKIVTLMNQIEKVHTFALAGGQYNSGSIMISKRFTLLANTTMFHQYIWECSHMKIILKT